MHRLPPGLVVLLLACCLIGCRGGAREQSYHVTVVNEADEPVMLWLAKDQPPYEPQWLTPSQWLDLRDAELIPDGVPEPGVELPPRMKVELGPQSGRFERGARAILLVFSTPVTLEEMAATPSQSSLRKSVVLRPGENFVRIESARPVRAQRVQSLQRPAEQRP